MLYVSSSSGVHVSTCVCSWFIVYSFLGPGRTVDAGSRGWITFICIVQQKKS